MVADGTDTHFKVLVVDDSESTRLLIARIITQELPVGVTLAANGDEAERELKQTHFDVILLDLLMPDTSGFAVLEWLRHNATPNQNTPVLVVSALQDEETIERCRMLGASVHIVKPILRERLVAAVREQLDAARRQNAPGGTPPAGPGGA
ncbi:MAG TPA: response regulator [Burkholderiales bacterium]|jgi:CheY-like chemotaxis protein|nr:response regulator [Burkholderiales bacterium]